jgi:hypothetical protein
MFRLPVALFVTLVLCTTLDRALADSTAPSSAVVQDIYKRYSPRLQGLTPAKVEDIWRGQVQREPWFRHTYKIMQQGKDDPGLVNKLRREFPCEDTSISARDQTYAVAARQYRCTTTISVQGATNVTLTFYLNVNEIGTLESIVLYQNMHSENLKQFVDAGLSQRDAMTLIELHFDVLSRIDNARAPSGSFVEYGKTGETQKFAVRFK